MEPSKDLFDTSKPDLRERVCWRCGKYSLRLAYVEISDNETYTEQICMECLEKGIKYCTI